MNFVVDQFKFLGLNDREVRVFTALSTFGRMNMTKISSRSGLSRTTVDAIVRRLVEKGLITKERVGGHFEYSVQLEQVANTLDWIEQRLRPNTCDLRDDPSSRTQPTPTSPRHSTPHPHSEQTATAMPPADHADMHRMVEQALNAHKGERVTMLVAALITDEKRKERFEHCLSHARAAEIRLEILTTTDVSKELSAYAREILAMLTAYDLRLNFLPPSFCIEHTDLVAFRDLVLIIDHQNDAVEQIEGARAVGVINHLLRVAREAGWGMDMKMWLEGVLNSQK